MTRKHYILIAATSMLLTGCRNADSKIVDLASTVFIIYIVLISLKYITPKIAKSQTFTTISHIINAHIKKFIYPLYFLSILLIGFGSISGNIINRIHIFTGLIIGIIAHYISEASKLETSEQKKMSIEIITLGLGILAVLFLLWGIGSALFKDFSIL